MNFKKTILVCLAVAACATSGPDALADSKVKFVNQSTLPVEVKVLSINPESPATGEPQSFKLPEKTTLYYDVTPPCLKGIWVNDVTKMFFPEDPSPAFRCLNLVVVDLVVTIRPNGETDITQR